MPHSQTCASSAAGQGPTRCGDTHGGPQRRPGCAAGLDCGTLTPHDGVAGRGGERVPFQFLRKLKTTLQIPILGLVDSDPHGLKILSVYMSGSKVRALWTSEGGGGPGAEHRVGGV